MRMIKSWRKSSYSGGNGTNCVEVADSRDNTVLVRDTKQHGHGQVHTFTAEQWRAFVASVRAGQLTLLRRDREPPAHGYVQGVSRCVSALCGAGIAVL